MTTSGKAGVGKNHCAFLTQKERDSESGLDYFLARYYSAAQGRFTSVDPVMVKSDRLRDPQRFNLYVYVRNNPLAFYDPDGQDLRAGTSKDQKKIKKALVEIAKRKGGREFLKKLNDVNIVITLNAGEVKGKSAYGSTSGGEIVRSRSTGEVTGGDPRTVTVDFKKAENDRKTNEAIKGTGVPVPQIENVPASDAHLQGHELAHLEAQISRTPDTEDAADARINSILAEPQDPQLKKDAEKFIENVLKPKDQEQKRIEEPKRQ